MLLRLQRNFADKSSPTIMSHWLIGACLFLVATTVSAETSKCGMPEITSSRELHQFLSLRAVEVIKLATDQNYQLAELITPSSSFNLGAGDVGRPLGTGVNGARELARIMNADTYRFLGWNYMDMPADACSKQKVEVEFIDSQAKNVSRVEFVFESGRVVSASGWERTYVSGQL